MVQVRSVTSMKDYHINIFYSEEDGGYIADIPHLEVCSAFGSTPDKAPKQVELAKIAWLEAARTEGKSIPQPKHKPVIYQIAAQIGGFQDNVTILAAEDINADGAIELAYTTTSCGAHTCFTAVHLLAWTGDELSSLSEGQIEMPYSEVSLENRDDDPALELLLHGGMIGSVGAGPQRTRIEIYDWSGTYYVPSETIYDESDFLYFKVLDASTALLGGDFTRAIALYQEAIDDADLRVWHEQVEGGQDERQDLVAFSRFRLALTYLLMNDPAGAETIAQALQQEQPDHVYNQATQVLLDHYTKEGTVVAACQAVTEFSYEFPETAEVLEDFGYTNPTFTVDQVCPAALANLIP